MERVGGAVDSLAQQPLDSDLVRVLVAILGPDQNLPDDQTPLGGREKSVAVLDHKSAQRQNMCLSKTYKVHFTTSRPPSRVTSRIFNFF